MSVNQQKIEAGGGNLCGFLNLLKPCGMSSSDAVFRVRKCLNLKTCGHMGTLDPGAAGVLPVAAGRAARLFDYLLDKRKRYRAVFCFGRETDTLDSYGRVVAEGRIPSREEIESVLTGLTGEVMQTAPRYSAKKIDGHKGYELARRGVSYLPPAKRVLIHSLRMTRQLSPSAFEFDIECGGGTYIRSLARDMAAKLGTVAYMQTLIRTQSGGFRIEDSVTLEELPLLVREGTLPWTSPDEVVRDVPELVLPDELFFQLDNGVKLPVEGEGIRRVYCGGVFFGMGSAEEGFLRIRTRIKG